VTKRDGQPRCRKTSYTTDQAARQAIARSNDPAGYRVIECDLHRRGKPKFHVVRR
jgi:hypothetical protein